MDVVAIIGAVASACALMVSTLLGAKHKQNKKENQTLKERVAVLETKIRTTNYNIIDINEKLDIINTDLKTLISKVGELKGVLHND